MQLRAKFIIMATMTTLSFSSIAEVTGDAKKIWDKWTLNTTRGEFTCRAQGGGHHMIANANKSDGSGQAQVMTCGWALNIPPKGDVTFVPGLLVMVRNMESTKGVWSQTLKNATVMSIKDFSEPSSSRGATLRREALARFNTPREKCNERILRGYHKEKDFHYTLPARMAEDPTPYIKSYLSAAGANANEYHFEANLTKNYLNEVFASTAVGARVKVFVEKGESDIRWQNRFDSLCESILNEK